MLRNLKQELEHLMISHYIFMLELHKTFIIVWRHNALHQNCIGSMLSVDMAGYQWLKSTFSNILTPGWEHTQEEEEEEKKIS